MPIWRRDRNPDDAVGIESPAFARADVCRLPFHGDCFDAALDRGCFHYLVPQDRLRYADELRRVLRPGVARLSTTSPP